MLEYVDIVLSFSVVMLLLSLLVTSLVQVVIACWGLRGNTLHWGLERILMQIEPALGQPHAEQADATCLPFTVGFFKGKRWAFHRRKPESHAGRIADAVLRHVLLSHVGERRATSIRQEELIKLLDDLASSESKVLPLQTRTLLARIMAAAPAPELALGAQQLSAELEKAFPNAAQLIEHEIQRALLPTRKVTAQIGVWFDAVMDRTTETFLYNTRRITALVAVLLAFGCHVDSFSLLRQLATRPEVRAKLVQGAEATLRRAEDTFALTSEKQALASKSIAAVQSNLTTLAEAKILQDVPANLCTRADGENWLKLKLAGSTNLAACLAAYDRRFEERTGILICEVRENTKEIHKKLQEMTLAIVPHPFPVCSVYWTDLRHLLGTLMTALLLSLGAPFWYNTLRQLSSLRPAVAEKMESKS